MLGGGGGGEGKTSKFDFKGRYGISFCINNIFRATGILMILAYVVYIA